MKAWCGVLACFLVVATGAGCRSTTGARPSPIHYAVESVSVTVPRARNELQLRKLKADPASLKRIRGAHSTRYPTVYLMPGETRTVRILGKHAEGRVTAKAWYSRHVTTIEWVRCHCPSQ